MSEESVPQQGGTLDAQGASGPPKGLLQQMEELMATLNADLTALDADLQPGRRGVATGVGGAEGGDRPVS
ncbi:hypothetical protein [Streptomyces sp. NPDC000983]|uniref:hypothetical protein n=1 Tax=Streptomyces sp. NPDC000983 TaxID=3154373 RepID=UPI0033189416